MAAAGAPSPARILELMKVRQEPRQTYLPHQKKAMQLFKRPVLQMPVVARQDRARRGDTY